MPMVIKYFKILVSRMYFLNIAPNSKTVRDGRSDSGVDIVFRLACATADHNPNPSINYKLWELGCIYTTAQHMFMRYSTSTRSRLTVIDKNRPHSKRIISRRTFSKPISASCAVITIMNFRTGRALFSASEILKKRGAAGLRPDPLGELTALP